MNTIVPELRLLHSPDIPNLELPNIVESEPYCILLQAMFGPIGAKGEESFDFLVCNGLWLTERATQGAFFCRHHLVVHRFNISEIRSLLEEIARESAAESWEGAAEKIGRFGKWEFEDYIAQ